MSRAGGTVKEGDVTEHQSDQQRLLEEERTGVWPERKTNGKDEEAFQEGEWQARWPGCGKGHGNGGGGRIPKTEYRLSLKLKNMAVVYEK